MPKSAEELKEIISKEEAALLIKAQQQQLTLMEQQALRKLQERPQRSPHISCKKN